MKVKRYGMTYKVVGYGKCEETGIKELHCGPFVKLADIRPYLAKKNKRLQASQKQIDRLLGIIGRLEIERLKTQLPLIDGHRKNEHDSGNLYEY